MPRSSQGINKRLLAVITGISVLLAVILSVVLPSLKPLPVRIVDNIFLGAVVNLAAYLYFRLRASSEAKVQQDRIKRRKDEGRPKVAEQEALKRYDMFSIFERHFGVCALILFVLATMGAIIASLS